MNTLSPGKSAPRFKLPSSTGQVIDLESLLGGGPIVVYFYPKADTSGCTKEACGFRDALPDFASANVPVLGISPDPVEAVTKFAKKYDLNFPLLADSDHAVAQKYGVWGEKSMYGRKYWGVLRTTFVIGGDGKILHVFANVKPAGHEKQVLDWLGNHK